ncbi:MAG: MFS transporter [Calditrichaeota bacterium]|nr:MFS transporter [Calditrichota bacterium]
MKRPEWLTRPILGWVSYDFANSAFATTVLAVIFNRYFSEVVAGGESGTLFRFFGQEVRLNGATVWSYIVALSTGLVAITSPILGAIADQAGWRRLMLGLFTYIGVVATLGLSLVGEGEVGSGSLLFIVANFGFAGALVFYNAFLVDLGTAQTYGRISGLAWGVGYVGGGLCLVLNLLMLQKPSVLGFGPEPFSVGACVAVSGLWWGIFTLPTLLWVRDKAKPKRNVGIVRLTFLSWRRVIETLRQVRRYRQLARFLIAYLFFNDGIETVIVMASIFGAQVIGMEAGELVLFFIMIQGTALIGSLIFGYLADRIGNRRTLLLSLWVWLAVVLWAYKIGWLFDMRTEYYLLGILVGLVMGGSQAAARSLQALFTPSAHSAEFFGFFSVSGKVASVFGPLVYGTAIYFTGGLQSGILALGLFFIVGIILLITVNEGEGLAVARS